MSTATKQAVLYSFWRSSCAWRVRIGLNLKKIPYEIRPINLTTDENKTPEYKKIQPFGAVPAYIDNDDKDTALVESVAILEYLDETRPEFPLLPKDPYEKSVVRSLVQAIAMDIQPICQSRVLRYIGSEKEDEWAKHFLSEGFSALERMLEKTAGKYAFGDLITMADVLIVPQFYNGVRGELDMSQYPILFRINNTLQEEEAFKATHPSRQPDCPPEFREEGN
ncbi:Glutathione S-transferase zeta-1 [Modicella reniformis]|uniref:Glutathione S-transferase zeta-1 n=1 Tax=Modicella reniformis TaxID=1440133 RepID=A0A9P6IJR1_9FUNG|nr:Glutathione S-transferase zeta-1 [Modicella reniformis]